MKLTFETLNRFYKLIDILKIQSSMKDGSFYLFFMFQSLRKKDAVSNVKKRWSTQHANPCKVNVEFQLVIIISVTVKIRFTLFHFSLYQIR